MDAAERQDEADEGPGRIGTACFDSESQWASRICRATASSFSN